MCVCVCVCVLVRMYVSVGMNTYVCVSLSVCVCVCVYMHIYIHMYVCMCGNVYTTIACSTVFAKDVEKHKKVCPSLEHLFGVEKEVFFSRDCNSGGFPPQQEAGDTGLLPFTRTPSFLLHGIKSQRTASLCMRSV